MTRAKHQLDLIVPQRFYVHQQSRKGDRHLYASRTRFLPDALLALFDQRVWPVRAQEVLGVACITINQSITKPTFTRRIEEKASERRSGFSLEFFASCAWTKRPCF